jgi:uncharacterized protein with HEPN domain
VPRQPLVFVEDALASIALIEEIVAKHGKASFLENAIDYNAAMYALLKVSEAVKGIPEEWLLQSPGIKWRDIKAIGNRLRHEYFKLDGNILWAVMTDDMTPLAAALKRMRR